MTSGDHPQQPNRIERLQQRLEEIHALQQKRRPKDCQHPRYVLIGRRERSGATTYYEACATCGTRKRTGLWLSHDQVDQKQIDHWEDHRALNPPCQVCGEFGTELHHWAPRAIFGILADNFPTSWLCPPCHNHWHTTIANHYQQHTKTA